MLITYPKIAEVEVIGIPDKLRGEIVRAVIRLREGAVATERKIRQFCQQHMADYKLPRQIIFTDVLPQAASTAKACRKNLKRYLSKLSPSRCSPHQERQSHNFGNNILVLLRGQPAKIGIQAVTNKLKFQSTITP